MSDLTAKIKGFETQQSIQVDIGNLQLIDTSNFPNTVNKHEVIDETKEFQFIGKSLNSLKNKPEQKLISVLINMYDQKHPNIPQTNENIQLLHIHVNIEDIEIDLHLQQFLRIIDYLLIQVISLLTAPEYLSMNQAFYSNKANFKLRMIPGTTEQILDLSKNSSFMNIKVNLKQTSINLKASPFITSYFKLNVNNISIYNYQYVNNQKLLENTTFDQPIWCEQYIVALKNCSIVYFDESLSTQNENVIAHPFNLNLQCEMITAIQPFKYLFGDRLNIDDRMLIKICCSTLSLQFTNEEFFRFMHMVLQNFTRDDGQDQYYYYDYPILELYPASTMDVQVHVEKVELSFYDTNIYGLKQNFKFADLNLKKLRVGYLVNKDKTKIVKVVSEGLTSYFYAQNGSDIIKHGLINKNILVYKQFDELKQINKYNLMKQKLLIFDKLQFDEQPVQNPKIQFLMEMFSNYDSTMNIGLNGLTVNLQLQYLLKILQFFSFPPQIFPQPILILNKIFGYAMKITLDNIIIIAANTSSQQFGKGIAISIMNPPAQTIKSTSKPIEVTMNYLRRNDMAQFYKINDAHDTIVANMKVSINNFEMFVINIKEFQIQQKIDNLQKRQIISPFSFTYSSNSNVDMKYSNLRYLIYNTIDKIEIRSACQRITITKFDIEMLLDIIKEQTNYEPLIYQDFDKIFKPYVMELPLTWICKGQKIDIEVSQILFMLINDQYYHNFAPVLLFDIMPFDITFKTNTSNPKLFLPDVKSPDQIKLVKPDQTSIFIEKFVSDFKYFNAKINQWEPFLEKLLVKVDYNDYDQKINCDIVINQINFNVSIMLIKTLHNLTLQFKQDDDKSIYHEKYLTLFTIFNESGYDLEITRHPEQKIQKSFSKKLNESQKIYPLKNKSYINWKMKTDYNLNYDPYVIKLQCFII